MNPDPPDNNLNQESSNNDLAQVEQPQAIDANEQPVTDLVDALQSVDTTIPEATLNATSIEDNIGDRIELNEDPADPNVTFHDSERQAPLIKK